MRRWLVLFWLHGQRKAVEYRVKAKTRTDALVSVSGHVELTYGRGRVKGAQVMEFLEMWTGERA